MADHTWIECRGCDAGCQFCRGGLAACSTCGGGEGSLPTECPGQRMSEEESDRVYAGLLDYKDGAWVVLGRRRVFDFREAQRRARARAPRTAPRAPGS